jgi:uncharacterized membrane protein HdeD (DUF308 family)
MPSDTAFGAGPSFGLRDQDAMNATLARHWWAIMLRGVIAVLFGAIALAAPGAVLLSLAVLLGVYLLIDGVIGLVSTVRAVTAHGHWGALLAEAVLNLLVGLIALVLPGAAVLAFVLMMAAWALISGGLMLAAAVKLHASHGRWWLGLGGAASLGHSAGACADGGRGGADLVAGHLRNRLRHSSARLRLAAPGPASGACPAFREPGSLDPVDLASSAGTPGSGKPPIGRTRGGTRQDQSSRCTRSIRSCRSCASIDIVAIGRASRRLMPMGSSVSSQ